MNLPKGISISETTIGIYQESDSCDSNSLGQELILKTQDAGDGKFLVIETKRWSIGNDEEIDALANMLKQFIKENQ